MRKYLVKVTQSANIIKESYLLYTWFNNPSELSRLFKGQLLPPHLAHLVVRLIRIITAEHADILDYLVRATNSSYVIFTNLGLAVFPLNVTYGEKKSEINSLIIY